VGAFFNFIAVVSFPPFQKRGKILGDCNNFYSLYIFMKFQGRSFWERSIKGDPTTLDFVDKIILLQQGQITRVRKYKCRSGAPF
jgi:hypothetical protein